MSPSVGLRAVWVLNLKEGLSKHFNYMIMKMQTTFSSQSSKVLLQMCNFHILCMKQNLSLLYFLVVDQISVVSHTLGTLLVNI